MSIDRQWDIYLEQRGITPRAEVVPDHACQVFEEASEAASEAASERAELDAARELVENLLRTADES